MQIAYYDESGDDGFPKYASPIFVLSALYMHHLNWKDSFQIILEFRRQLKADYGLPVKMELHSKYFILNKNPYRTLGISDENRKAIVSLFCQLIAGLNLKIINIAILKTAIQKKRL